MTTSPVEGVMTRLRMPKVFVEWRSYSCCWASSCGEASCCCYVVGQVWRLYFCVAPYGELRH